MRELRYVPLPSPGSIVGRFRLLREIGKGGMGSVFEAIHLDSGQRVALKVAVETTLGAEGVLREIRALKHPIDSEHVVRYIGSGDYFADEEGTRMPWLALELLEGKTLDQLVKERGQLPLPEALEIALQVGKGLLEVHRHGLLHRDVKPPNIFLSSLPNGTLHVRLIDFGIACEADKQREGLEENQTFGTPAYMSPEQIQGKDLDPSVDGYGLALTFLFMLMGRRARPFPAYMVDMMQVIRSCQPDMVASQLSELGLPSDLEATLASLLAYSSKDRCTIKQALDVFEHTLHPPPATIEGHNEPSGRTNYPRWYAVAAGMVLAFFASMLAVYVVARPSPPSPLSAVPLNPASSPAGRTIPPPQLAASGLLPNGKPRSSLAQSDTVGTGVKPRPARRARLHREPYDGHAPSRYRRRHRSRTPF